MLLIRPPFGTSIRLASRIQRTASRWMHTGQRLASAQASNLLVNSIFILCEKFLPRGPRRPNFKAQRNCEAGGHRHSAHQVLGGKTMWPARLGMDERTSTFAAETTPTAESCQILLLPGNADDKSSATTYVVVCSKDSII